MIEMNTGFLIKTSLSDFPETVCSIFFLKGCNLRCPYCYNKALVLPGSFQKEEITLEELYIHLEKRKKVIQGFVLSGGEALLSEKASEILKTAKKLGYRTKLDTNGTLPEKLLKLISDKENRPDYVALDIKTSFEKYSLLHSHKLPLPPEKSIMTTIKILQQHSINFEVRTVLVPGLVAKEELKQIAKIIPEDISWFLSGFQNFSCLDPEYEKIKPYSSEEFSQLKDFATSMHKKTFER